MRQINPQLLSEWKKEGEILAIWQCERCHKQIPFYKTGNPLIDFLYESFAHNEKYCCKCKLRLQNLSKQKNTSTRTIKLLKKYEGIIVEISD